MTPPWSEWFVRGSEGALDKRRRGTNGEEVYYWRIGRGGGLHESQDGNGYRKSADTEPDGHGFGFEFVPAGADTGTTLNPTDIC